MDKIETTQKGITSTQIKVFVRPKKSKKTIPNVLKNTPTVQFRDHLFIDKRFVYK